MKINDLKMRDLIQKLCNQKPELANDDKKLIATIWWLEGWEDPELYEHLKSVSSPETIRRTRAKLVEEGIITPSEETTEKRYEEFKKAREDLEYGS